jgi:ABC-2 type transport system permease protein
MSAVLLIARRELLSYLRTLSGYVIAAVVLLLGGLAFNALALRGAHKSFDVLQFYFFWVGDGMVMIAGAILAMRLFAEERQLGTLVLLETSPQAEHSVVLGKFLGAWLYMLLFVALTLYVPLLVMVNGKVTLGHVLSGYLGMALLGAVTIGLGALWSSLAPNQVVAVILTAATLIVFSILQMIGGKVEGALGDVLVFMDLFNSHYKSFSRGTIRLESVVYFVALTYFALLSTTAILSARRWRA